LLFDGKATQTVKSFDKTNPVAQTEQTPLALYMLQFGIVELTATHAPPVKAKLLEHITQA
jgi:hypothetical protein